MSHIPYVKHDRQIHREYKNMSKSVMLDIKKDLNKRIKNAHKDNITVSEVINLHRARIIIRFIIKNRI